MIHRDSKFKYLYSNLIDCVYRNIIKAVSIIKEVSRAPEGNVIKANDNLPDVKHRSTTGKG